MKKNNNITLVAESVLLILALAYTDLALATKPTTSSATDPGSRPSGSTNPGAGPGGTPGPTPIDGLTPNELSFFYDGLAQFIKVHNIADGLGPRFNLDSCGGCHSQPTIGGSSPAINPQLNVINVLNNDLPSFLKADGPVIEARFVKNADGTPDGGVHELFVISGLVDATGDASNCIITQPNFAAELSNNNVVFRIPTPTLGLGFVEMITDEALYANIATNPALKRTLNITPRLNTTGNDGTVTRFGWKSQNKSLLQFSGEAYNVEMGVSNDQFQNERENNTDCQFKTVPNDFQNMDALSAPNAIDAAFAATTSSQKLANFSRFLSAPVAVDSYTDSTGLLVDSDSIARGKDQFTAVGCNECHTPNLNTSPNASVVALAGKQIKPYSDFALHNMGSGLADGIRQGGAQGDEFRTAPLWGIGQRHFFLHDGRSKDLTTAISAHKSGTSSNGKYPASEANFVIDKYNALSDSQKLDLLKFLRAL